MDMKKIMLIVSYSLIIVALILLAIGYKLDGFDGLFDCFKK